MSERGDEVSSLVDEAPAVVRMLARVEGRLARPFAERRVILGEEQLDEPGLAALRRDVLRILEPADAAPLRVAFQRAFDRARTEDRPAAPATPAKERRPEMAPAPPVAMAPAVEEPRFTPSYLLVPTPGAAAVSAPPSDAADETAFLVLARPGPTLPFVEGDARAFIEAARVSADSLAPESPGDQDRDDAAASPGDATQALDLRKVLEDVVPFQLEVERSLTAFVDLLVALTSAPGREDEVGARFGVHTPIERERVLAGWRRRWDAEPGLRAEWQRLYQRRVDDGGRR